MTSEHVALMEAVILPGSRVEGRSPRSLYLRRKYGANLLAIARDAGVDLRIEDFNRVGRAVPLLANLSPHGKFHMSDLDRIGGVPAVQKELLANGLLHGECMTVTGKTVRENIEAMDAELQRGKGREGT